LLKTIHWNRRNAKLTTLDVGQLRSTGCT